MHCLNCGFPTDQRNLPAVCPKCDEDLVRAKARKPLVVDLAHNGETVSQALAKLDAAVGECVWHGNPSLKVIHGHGGGFPAHYFYSNKFADLAFGIAGQLRIS